ncbi:MAG TPA: hypothetical protein VFU31_30960 [Candidatus Binatia bacterium]|nr:hypothetical protein [Candidatus Binatia bacterium]
MNRFGLTSLLLIFLLSWIGCTTNGRTYTTVTLYQQEAGGGYCHKKLQPIGSTDLGRPAQIGGDGFIDYYGPCDGPSVSEQIQAQKRFERFRFGRDYADEG